MRYMSLWELCSVKERPLLYRLHAHTGNNQPLCGKFLASRDQFTIGPPSFIATFAFVNVVKMNTQNGNFTKSRATHTVCKYCEAITKIGEDHVRTS